MFTSVFMLPGILFSLISLSLTVVYKIIITFPVRPFWSIFGFFLSLFLPLLYIYFWFNFHFLHVLCYLHAISLTYLLIPLMYTILPLFLFFSWINVIILCSLKFMFEDAGTVLLSSWFVFVEQSRPAQSGDRCVCGHHNRFGCRFRGLRYSKNRAKLPV